MERVGDIDAGIARERRRLARAYRALRGECAGDPELFAARWRDRARTWDFEELNVLIEQHNAWYPIERDLPLNPRTGDYVRVGGRSYRRPMLGEQWVLEQFRRRRRMPRDGIAAIVIASAFSSQISTGPSPSRSRSISA